MPQTKLCKNYTRMVYVAVINTSVELIVNLY